MLLHFLPSQPFGFCSNGASDFIDRFVWHLKVGQINVAYDLYSRIRQAGTGEAVMRAIKVTKL